MQVIITPIYKLVMYIDGGYRHNNSPKAVGAALCVLFYQHGERKEYCHAMPSSPIATSQRAELTALILALERAIYVYDRA